MTVVTADWQAKAQVYKDSLLSKIPTDYLLPPSNIQNDEPSHTTLRSVLSPLEREITILDATALRDAIASRKYTSVEVIKAYAHAAAIVHQRTNCLMDYFLDEALERAKWLDDELERTGKPVGPLHGVPISVKDHLGLKGREVTAGFLSWVGNHVPIKDSVIISILRNVGGAVFWVKTTNPQAIMHLETNSFLGPTVNPYNAKLTAGGSSGGEGALVGGGGSPLGIGTDIGGSIRNPAANCGIYGFKPTSLRLPKAGNFTALAGQESIVGAIGPMARSVRDMYLFITTILAAEPWKFDNTVVRMPWRPEEVIFRGSGRGPKIGVMWDDGVVRLQPPMRRALALAVDKLRGAGLEVVEYKPFGTAESWDIISSLYMTDGGERVRGHVAESGEPLLPLTEWIMQNAKVRPPHELWELVVRRETFRNEYSAHFQSQDVDVILCAPNPGPANELGKATYWSYTSIFNLADYPAGVFPTGLFVDPAIDKKDGKYDFLSAKDEEYWAAYVPENMAGAPLALQVVAPRWEDEKVMKALEIISDIVRV
ncbi:hypothetical protein CI109_105445 [Kwoniella shandongensis]|uniref:amidase n=1 Tax=Kwoniella shandongensis TaxID=1734106 RepID=A0A5M6C713_9TREE|nr:uncharacterized protein CI109_002166 [Kwoniella shandongensis]KAA5529275.1 hypothetical protein CI109_002166 [Kwoniella shandongensis]